MFYPSTQQDEHQTSGPARPRGPKTRGSYSTKSRPAMISTHSDMPKSMAISSAEASDEVPVNWWEPRGRQRHDQRASPIPIPDSTPKAQMLEIGGMGLGLPPHMRSFSPAPQSAVSDGPASPAALFLSAFSSPAPSVRSPSPLPSMISPAMAMFHSPPPIQSNAPVASPTTSLIDTGVSVGGYVLGTVIGHGGFSTIRTATSSTTGGVVAVKIVPTKSVSLPADAPRGRGGNRAATVGRAATTTARGRTPDPVSNPVSDPDGRPIAEEAALWSTLSHEHILPLFSAEESEPLGAWFLFTLYCPAGTLLDLLKRDGQIISPSAHNTPSKRRPSFASSFSPVNSISRGRSGSINQPQPQRGGLLPETAATLFRQVVRGLRYLHEVARVVHRDIKLENVLVDENGGARITDFGLAVQMDDEPVYSSVERSRSRVDRPGRSVSRHRTFSSHAPLGHGPAPPSHGFGRANSVSVTNVTSNAKNKFPPGSMPYAAPELLKPARSRERRSRERTDIDKPNPAQDIWALGCVLHALFTGKLPFSDAFEPRLQMKIVRGIWDEGVATAIPNSAALLETLRGCLCVELSERWTTAMVDEYAWAIGVADEEAEREAMRAQRGRSVGRGRRGLSAIRDRDGARDEDGNVQQDGSVQGGLESSYSPSNRSVSRSRPSASENIRPTRLPSMTRLAPHEAAHSSPNRPSLSPHDPVSPVLTRQRSSPSRHQSPARPSLIPRPALKPTSLAGGAATPTKQPSAPTGLVAPASTLEILDSSTSTPVPIPRNERLSPHDSPSLHTARSFSSVTSSAVPPLSPGSDGTRSPLVERTGRAPSVDRLGRELSIGRGRSIGPRDKSTGRAPSADRSSRAPSAPRTPSVDRPRRTPSTDRRSRGPSAEPFAKTRPPVDTAQTCSPPSSGPRTPEEIPQARRFASELEVVDEGEHHAWVGVQAYQTRKPQV